MIAEDVKAGHQLYHPTQITKLEILPLRRSGKRLNIATLHRWFNDGLEFVRVGSTRCTTVPAMLRFFVARATKDAPAGQTPAPNLSEIQQELDEIGL